MKENLAALLPCFWQEIELAVEKLCLYNGLGRYDCQDSSALV